MVICELTVNRNYFKCFNRIYFCLSFGIGHSKIKVQSECLIIEIQNNNIYQSGCVKNIITLPDKLNWIEAYGLILVRSKMCHMSCLCEPGKQVLYSCMPDIGICWLWANNTPTVKGQSKLCTQTHLQPRPMTSQGQFIINVIPICDHYILFNVMFERRIQRR